MGTSIGKDFKNLIVKCLLSVSQLRKSANWCCYINGGVISEKHAANAVQMSRRRCRRRHVDTKEICTVPTFLSSRAYSVKLRYVLPDIARSTNCAK